MLSFFFIALLALPPSISVCASGCSFSDLSSAVQHAEPSTTIIVRQGGYTSSGAVVIDRPLTVRGEGWPTLSGNGQEDVLVVKAPQVTIEGLVIRNSGISYVHELAGVRIEDSADCTIRNNRFENNAYGVYLANAERCLVSRNQISSSYTSESEAGNGIHSWHSRSLNIERNEVSGHRDGIYLEFTNDSHIAENTVAKNLRYGLHFMTSHRNEYRANRFEQNGAGVAVMYSRNITMIENRFADNVGMAAYGLLLKDISSGNIERNIFDDNTFGIYMEGTNRSKFAGNIFKNNGVGLRVLGDCDDNRFEHNNFEGNTFAVTTNSSRNPNQFESNYWSGYQGYDVDLDGVGDVPFRPVSLSSVLVEQLDTTYVLIKSPLFLLLDQIEQAFPMLIPESLIDRTPLMKPWTKGQQ